MTARLLLFGTVEQDRVLSMLTRFSTREVVAVGDMAIDDALGSFDKAQSTAFACADAGHLNQDRLSAYMALKAAGFRIDALASGDARIASDVRLRENVFVEHGVEILPRANIGANCWLMSGAAIGTGVRLGTSCWIGERCRIGHDAVLGKNCTLGAGVVIGPGVVLPAWSSITEPIVLKESPVTPIFIDSRFKNRVTLHGQ